jgi:hypothetical protein
MESDFKPQHSVGLETAKAIVSGHGGLPRMAAQGQKAAQPAWLRRAAQRAHVVVTATTAGTVARAPVTCWELARGVVFGRRTVMRMRTHWQQEGYVGSPRRGHSVKWRRKPGAAVV